MLKNIFITGGALLLLGNISRAQNLVWSEKCAPTSKETYAVAFSQDGSKVFSGSECTPTSLRIFDGSSGSLTWDYLMGGQLMCAQGVKFNSNGSKVVALEELGNLLVFDYTTPTPTLLSTIPTGTSYAFAIAFSPDGNRMATGCSNKKLMIHDLGNAAVLHNYDAHANWVTGVDWSVNERIVTCGDDLKINLWDTSGNNLWSVTGHTSVINCVKFTTDGQYIVSGSRDKTIKVWNASNGTLVTTLNGHTGEVRALDISDDGTRIVSASVDSTIRVWDFSSGNQLYSFKQPGAGKIYTVDFKPGSTQFVAAGTSKGDVQVWDLQFPTGINKIDAPENAHIYPNPCSDHMTVSAGEKILSAAVYDVTGKKCTVPIDIQDGYARVSTLPLSPGHYYIQLHSAVGREAVSFTKR